MSDNVPISELATEKIYFAQLRTNNQITVPKECIEEKRLEIGDIVAVAIIKLVGKETNWRMLKEKFGDLI